MRGLVRAALACVVVFPSVVLGADSGALPPPSSPGWTITLGVEGRVLPSFEGSDRYVLAPFPIVNIRRAGTHARFKAPRDGISVSLFETENFRLGPVGKVRLPRNMSDDGDLLGLGDVDWAFEFGGFVEYWFSPLLRTRAEIRQGFGGHHGLVADLTADIVYPISPRWTLSGGPRLSFASGAAQDPYFSVSPAQSVLSGLPVYNAGGGIHSYGAGAQARYQWSPQWAAHIFVEYERLADDAANSPLVVQRGSADQVTFGVGVAYSFDVGGP